MKRVGLILGGLVGLIILALEAGAWHFSSLLLETAPHACPERHYVYCKDPSQLGLAFEDVRFATRDGFNISAWLIPARKKDRAPAVVLVHGRGATRREGMRYARVLHDAGFQLLLIDLRNCGESDKSFSSMGFHERKDVHAAVRFLKEKRGVGSIGVMAFSMGAATSIMAMAENNDIKAGVFEGGFMDVDSVLSDKGKADFGLPRFPLVPLVRLNYELRGNLNTADPSPVSVIGLIAPRPVFIIHGTGDREVGHHHGEGLFAAAREPKIFWSVPGARHTQAWQADRKQAETRVRDFFKATLITNLIQ